MKIIGAISCCILVIIAIYVISYRWFLPYLHDQTLKDFSSPFLDISVPEMTQEIDRISRVGLQAGGNNEECDYLAAFLLKTDLPKTYVEKYYEHAYKGKSKVNFYWVNEPHSPGIGVVNSTGIITLNDWINTKAKETGANLIVYIFEGDMTSSVDLRCSGPVGI